MISTLSDEILKQPLVTIKPIESVKVKAIVDRCFPLENTADAHRYFESCEKKEGTFVKENYVVCYADVSNCQRVAH